MHDASPYHSARFLTSAPDLRRCPDDTGAEVAFCGRSNAGKSSAINLLTGQTRLARTSKTPGRTQQINFFTLDAERRLVDLPGYGYAKVPEATRRRWEVELARYLRERECLRGLVLVSDLRRELPAGDRHLLEWAEAGRLPVHVLLTKADKLSRGAARQTLQRCRKELAGREMVTLQLFSALSKEGLEELRSVLDAWLGFL